MKEIKRNLIIISALFTASLFLIALYSSLSFSADSAMRRTIFFSGHPIAAFTVYLPDHPAYHDERHRECYDISDPSISNGSEKSIPGICMKKNAFGMYSNITIGIY